MYIRSRGLAQPQRCNTRTAEAISGASFDVQEAWVLDQWSSGLDVGNTELAADKERDPQREMDLQCLHLQGTAGCGSDKDL